MIIFFPIKRYIIPQQHGFIRGRSTINKLDVLTPYCTDNFEKCYQVDTIYSEFSKAFERVLHNLLIYKLEKFGLRDRIRNWLRSYLLNRHFRVCLDGV